MILFRQNEHNENNNYIKNFRCQGRTNRKFTPVIPRAGSRPGWGGGGGGGGNPDTEIRGRGAVSKNFVSGPSDLSLV